MTRHCFRLLLLMAALLGGHAAAAAEWPSKPVRIIVPYPPGGVGDMSTRAFAARFAETIGQPVNVENLPGGNQIIGVQAAASAEPDGHTLVVVTPTSLVLNPALRQTLPYAPEKLTLISQLYSSPLFVIVNPKVPASSIAELIAYAKANPGMLNYASTGEGAATHLITERFNQVADIRMNHVPYKGGSAIAVDLLSGVLQVYFDPGAASLPMVRDGRLRALAVTGTTRSRSLPEVPTVIEAGTNYDVISWWGLGGPEGIPPEVAKRISAAAAKAIGDGSALADQAIKLGIEYRASSPEEFTAFVDRERNLWGGVVKTLGLKAQ
jgi:tripartite-type tricarboxylate transporter receptor subunit TctC